MGRDNRYASQYSNEGFSDPPGTLDVSRTVGVGVTADFDTFEAAWDWAVNYPATGRTVTLNLLTDIVLRRSPQFFTPIQTNITYLAFNKCVLVTGSGGVRTLTLDPAVTWSSMNAIFAAFSGFLSFQAVHIDVSAHPLQNSTIPLYFVGGLAGFAYATITGASKAEATATPRAIYATSGAELTVVSSTIDNFRTGISVHGGTAVIGGTTVKNCGTGLQAIYGGTISQQSNTFTSNTANLSPATQNQIQYDGAIIRSNTAALSFKA